MHDTDVLGLKINGCKEQIAPVDSHISPTEADNSKLW